jgi:hypothetical protein
MARVRKRRNGKVMEEELWWKTIQWTFHSLHIFPKSHNTNAFLLLRSNPASTKPAPASRPTSSTP